MAWTRTDDDLCRVEIDYLLQSDFVVPVDSAAGAFEHEELVDIPGEGVVIVDQDDIRIGDRRARVGRNGHSDWRLVGYMEVAEFSGVFQWVDISLRESLD